MAAAFGAKVKEDAEEMFLPTYDPSKPTQTEDEMLAELMKLPGAAEWAAKNKAS